MNNETTKRVGDAIRTIENLASEPLFGGQKERLENVLDILLDIWEMSRDLDRAGDMANWPQETWDAFLCWRDRFSLGHPGRSQFMELTDDDRKQLYALFLKLAGPQR